MYLELLLLILVFSQGLSVFLGAYSRLMNNDHFLHVNLAHFPTMKLHIDSNGLSVHEERGKNEVYKYFISRIKQKLKLN